MSNFFARLNGAVEVKADMSLELRFALVGIGIMARIADRVTGMRITGL